MPGLEINLQTNEIINSIYGCTYDFKKINKIVQNISITQK